MITTRLSPNLRLQRTPLTLMIHTHVLNQTGDRPQSSGALTVAPGQSQP